MKAWSKRLQNLTCNSLFLCWPRSVNHRILYLQKPNNLNAEASKLTNPSLQEQTRNRSIFLRVFLAVLGFAGGFDSSTVENVYNGAPLHFRVFMPKDCRALSDEQQLVAVSYIGWTVFQNNKAMDVWRILLLYLLIYEST